MKITFISPNRADINAHFNLLKPAFNGVAFAKEEYQFCCEAVRNKQASLYQVKAEGVDVRFVGVVTEDNDYLILALTGKGLVKTANFIIDAVGGQGYRSIKYHTVRSGMIRILSRFGFCGVKTDIDTVLTLNMEEC
ncbi:MAG: hypothetical protein ACI86X_000673 [Moritella sp.]|jgi:hypothetical protein